MKGNLAYDDGTSVDVGRAWSRSGSLVRVASFHDQAKQVTAWLVVFRDTYFKGTGPLK